MAVPRSAQYLRFEALYQAYYSTIWAYARRRVTNPSDADDVAAQTWLAVWRRIDSVPQDRELPWCYGVARRCLANQRRSTARGLRLTHLVATERVHDAIVETTDPRIERLVEAMTQLSDDDQELLRLAAWERLTHRDIAVVIGTSTANVAVRFSRAKTRLARILQDSALQVSGPQDSGLQDSGPPGHTTVTTPLNVSKGLQ